MGAPISRLISSRIPTGDGEFTLHLYRQPGEDKDHLALTLGDVTSRAGVLVRIHSECFTGDVLASRRCDCGEQLERATRLIAREGRGILVYLRQEGRGIGLLEKLKAYNLQDQGHDTVEANELLGHQADERDYAVAAAILRDLGLTADSELRLLTNNPAKIESLVDLGFRRCRRMALQTPIRSENFHYLSTKARRMRHLLHVGPRPATPSGNGDGGARAEAALASAAPLNLLIPVQANGRPSITLTYAQSLDGSITVRRGESMTLSGPESLTLTHALRAQHDGILVGIETVLTDDPRLTVRLVEGPDPQPVVLDSRLRTPTDARLFRHPTLRPWIATTTAAEARRERALIEAGATVFRVEPNAEGQVNLGALLPQLHERGISSLMVEGGARVITSFLAARAVDRLVLTIAPLLVGGLNAVGDLAKRNGKAFPKLRNPRYQWLGPDLVLLGDLHGELEWSLDRTGAARRGRELED